MGLKIRLLHFHEPIPALGSAGSLAADSSVGGGPAIAESIRRFPGGYLVGWKNRLYFIPDSRIACCEVVDEDVDTAPPRPLTVTPANVALAPNVTIAAAPATATQITAALLTREEVAAAVTTPDGPPPEPGSIIMDKFGRYSKVPFPDAPKAAPATAAEPTPEEPAHTMKRSGRTRRSMTDQHASQAPTALEAAVAEDEEAQG